MPGGIVKMAPAAPSLSHNGTCFDASSAAHKIWLTGPYWLGLLHRLFKELPLTGTQYRRGLSLRHEGDSCDGGRGDCGRSVQRESREAPHAGGEFAGFKARPTGPDGHVPSYDRPSYDQPSYDRPSYDRPSYDRP